jgi:hypothetical protein
MNDVIVETVALLKKRWIYFTPAGQALCFRLLGSVPLPTLYAVRKYMTARQWSPRHLWEVRNFLERCVPSPTGRGTNIIITEEALRNTLYHEYCTIRNVKTRSLLAGFLDPPIQLALAPIINPDTVVAIMLLGAGALCRDEGKLATFREMVHAYK